MFDSAVVHGASDLHVERHPGVVKIVRSRDGEVILQLTPLAAAVLCSLIEAEVVR